MLILASASKSRKNLLESSDMKFIQISSSFDESSVKKDNIDDLANELSFLKAKSVINKIKKIDFNKKFNYSSLQILGCDSIFEFQGKAFGKPVNKQEAYERWLEMSSKYGILHTGHTLLFCDLERDSNQIVIRNEVKKVISTKIFFGKLKEIEIEKYVNTNEPLLCAGGFALEGKGGKFIEKIEGCFSNVMGLSLPWLRKTLLMEDIFA